MRLLFTRFPLESTLGGAEIQTLSLMEGLMERGHAVAFAGSCPVLLAECKKRNIPHAKIDIGHPPVTKWGAMSFVWRKQGMKKILEGMLQQFSHEASGDKQQASSGKLDAIIMLSLSEKLLLTNEAAKRGTKVIWIEHDKVGQWLTHNPWLPQLIKQSNHAMTVTVSELSRKIYVGLGWNSERIVAIPNGVRELQVGKLHVTHSNLQPENLQPENKCRLGCIARLSPEKGVDVLIEAMSNLPKHITLEIVGRGSQEYALKLETCNLQLETRVTFTPHEPDVSNVFKRIDALVLPSKENDPFGMVAAEAMMCGLPVIVTDQCGIADYVEDGKDAMIAKAGSASDLHEKIQLLTTNYSLLTQIGKEAQKTAEKIFSIKTMVEKYEHVLTGDSTPS